jgi:hypothetical protein
MQSLRHDTNVGREPYWVAWQGRLARMACCRTTIPARHAGSAKYRATQDGADPGFSGHPDSIEQAAVVGWLWSTAAQLPTGLLWTEPDAQLGGRERWRLGRGEVPISSEQNRSFQILDASNLLYRKRPHIGHYAATFCIWQKSSIT